MVLINFGRIYTLWNFEFITYLKGQGRVAREYECGLERNWSYICYSILYFPQFLTYLRETLNTTLYGMYAEEGLCRLDNYGAS